MAPAIQAAVKISGLVDQVTILGSDFDHMAVVDDKASGSPVKF